MCMSKAGYIGVSDIARKIKKMYVGVDGIARKVKKAYVGVDGVARLWFVSRYFEYTGNYTEQTVTMGGKTYALYTLTSSGSLSCSEGRFWMCGGGSAGGAYGTTYGGMGGGGGYVKEMALADGEYSVVIGAGGTAGNSSTTGGSVSSIAFADGTAESAAGGMTDGRGGSAGGGRSKATRITATSYSQHSYEAGPNGAGVSTIPFGIVSLWPHCAGGGGGSITTSKSTSSTTVYSSNGGWGGQNGGSGGQDDKDRPDGGFNGGGYGGTYDSKGGSAKFYGSGGGGASGGRKSKSGGSGYQGVAYVLQEIGQGEESNEIPIYAKGLVNLNSYVDYNKIDINGTTYTEEGNYSTAKGNSVTVKKKGNEQKIYFNGSIVAQYKEELVKEITYTFTAQKPTLIICGYNEIYIIEQGA